MKGLAQKMKMQPQDMIQEENSTNKQEKEFSGSKKQKLRRARETVREEVSNKAKTSW